MTKVIEKYGLYGMSKAELQRMARYHAGKRNMESRRIVAACERIIFWKRMAGFE